MSNPDIIEVSIERPAVGGRMIGRHGGQIVLVSGAIPGERVRALVERRRRDVVFANVVDVLEPSPDRRLVSTPPECGGQSFAHIEYRRQLVLKAEIIRDGFRRVGHITLDEIPSVAASPERGYRMRARLHVGDDQVGFLEEGSHRVCAATDTGQLLPETERLIDGLASRARRLVSCGIQSFMLAEDLAGGQRTLHAVVAGDLHAGGAALREVASTSGLTGVSMSSTSIGGPPTVVAGDPHVTDGVAAFLVSRDVGDFSLRRHPDAFFQANRYLVPGLVAAVERLTVGEQVVDLYSGVGLFAVSITAARGGRMTAVERDPAATRDLVFNANPLIPAISLVRTSVEAYLERTDSLRGAAVIVDPPRTGLSPEVAVRLTRCCPDRIVYVSCDVATQARDLRVLTAAGYRLAQVHAFDMFPNTPHVETVVTLDRAGGPSRQDPET
ncbi:MAG TPA: hypothetical protein DIU48_05875 [Acidobacteria bacterium]|nr:hypothetical protein [Acidobacteriota bacterium]